jgi:hypothetical protein
LVPVSAEHEKYQAIITHALKPQNVADEYVPLYSMETELVLSSNCVRTISKTTAFSVNPPAPASASSPLT